MNTLERLGGWLLLAGGVVYFVEWLAPQLKQFDAIARVAVVAGGGAWVIGHIA